MFWLCLPLVVLCFLFVCFCHFRAASTAYGDFQARGWFGAVAAGLHHSHSNSGSEACLWSIHHSSWQHRILNPLSEARDWTCILMDTSQIRFCWAMMGTPIFFFWSFCHFLGHSLGIWRFPGWRANWSHTAAYTRAIATQDLSRVCNPHHSSWQCRIFNPLSKAQGLNP